jgi:hypothetical protein
VVASPTDSDVAMAKVVVAATGLCIEVASFVIAISVSVYASGQVAVSATGSFHHVDPFFDTSSGSFSSLVSSVNLIRLRLVH